MKDDLNNYYRVGSDYYKKITKPDRYGISRAVFKKWNKQEIIQDFGRDLIGNVTKYNDFIMVPDNKNYKLSINDCYNMYSPFAHKAKEGDWKWTKILLEHIFGEQYELGLIYMQVLYLYPTQALPVLALVSKERQTAKSTFLDYLTQIFGANMVVVNAKDISSEFNGIYAQANIIGIEETFIDKTNTIEKIKAISTQKTMTVNVKGVQHFSLPFFGKIIMNSNNEDKFIKIDQSEIRFFVRKLSKPKYTNHNILEDLRNEIPAFLDHLETLCIPDFGKSRMVFTAQELENKTLKRVKEHSKTWLYKELKIHLREFFDNEADETEEMQASPKDIKNKLFQYEHNIQLNYLKSVLEDEFDLEKSDHVIRYSPFYSDPSKTGRPFTILRSMFIDTTPVDDNLPLNEELPF